MSYDPYDEAIHNIHSNLLKAKSKDEVAAIVYGITVRQFVELDERPGQFPGGYGDGNWHAWLRQLRNDPKSDVLDSLVR